MSSKTAKKRKPRPSTEFGDWLFGEKEEEEAPSLPLSMEQQAEVCWLHLALGLHWSSCTDIAELRDQLHFDRLFAHDMRRWDTEDAYDDRDKELRVPFHTDDYYGWDEPEDFNYFGSFDDLTAPEALSLDERINDALGADWKWKPLTKKRREADSTARNKRRDGSPRDKVGRSVDKACNHRLRRAERREWRLDLAGRVDPDQLSHPRGRTPASWDKSAW